MADQSKKQQPKQQPKQGGSTKSGGSTKQSGTTKRDSRIGDSKESMKIHRKAAEIPPKTGSGTGSRDKKKK